MNVSMKQKIGIVSYDIYPGGGGMGHHILHQWQWLREQGHDVLRFSSMHNDHHTPGKVTVYLPRWLYHFKNLWMTWAFFRRKRVREKKYGVTHRHLHSWPWWVHYPRWSRTPIIYSTHHTYNQQRTMVWWDRFLRLYLLSYLERWSYKFAHTIIPITHSTARDLHGYYRVSQTTQPVYNTLPRSFHSSDISWDKQINKQAQRRSNDIVVVWRIEWRKNTKAALYMLKHLIDTGYKGRMHLVGEDTSRYAQECKELMRSLDLESRVIFHGYVSRDRRDRLLQQSRFLLSPSLCEWMGISVLEWYVAGLYCICNNVVWFTDIAEHLEDVILVNCQNYQWVASILSTILSNDVQINMHYRHQAIQIFSYHQFVQRYTIIRKRILTTTTKW